MTLLDKVIAYSHDISYENVSAALNKSDFDSFFALLSAVSKKDNGRVIATIHEVYQSGVNFCEWFEQFHSFLVNVVKYIYTKDVMSTTIPDHYAEKMDKYTQAHAAICLRLASIIVRMCAEMKHTVYQEEIALTYLCVPERSGEQSA